MRWSDLSSAVSGAPGWAVVAAGAAAAVAAILVARRIAGGGVDPAVQVPPECDDSLRAVHHGGTRSLSPGRIRLLVLHSTEGETAAGAAGWFTQAASGGSTHAVVDDSECYRTLDEDVVPWGASGDRANEDGLHVEMAGYARWTRDEWLSHRAEIEKAAAVVLDWARRYDVPLVFLTAADLRAQGGEARGITTHWEVTKAFDVEGGHVDPGPEFPIDVFLRMIGGRVSDATAQAMVGASTAASASGRPAASAGIVSVRRRTELAEARARRDVTRRYAA